MENIFEKREAIVPLEFTQENNDNLFGIEPKKAEAIRSGLATTLAEREALKDAYIGVIKLEISPETISIFKELRLKIVKNRTQGIEKWHKNEKAFYLAGGKFVDAIKNKEIAVNQGMEENLLDAEKFYERQEAEKKQAINRERIEKIRPYVEDVTGLDFSEMNDYDFEDYVLGKKTRFENEAKAKLEAEEKAEAERIAEIERQKAIEAENAKLKAEADKAAAALEKERAEVEAKRQSEIAEAKRVQDLRDAEAKAKQDAIELKAKLEANKQAELQAQKDAEIKKEREAREKLEADLKAKQDAELKAEQEAKKEAEKLAKAPIKKQFSVWVDSFELPNTNINNEVSQEIKAKFEAFKKWSLTQVNNL